MSALRSSAIRALKWSATQQFVVQGLAFGITVTMARLVKPDDFGTVALLYLFTGLAQVFVDGGLSQALIQRKDTTPLDESTVFLFNLTAGISMAGLLFFAAPKIAGFYSIPVLEPIARIYSLQFVFGAFASVPNALFQKALDFRTPMAIAVIATAGSAVAGIWLAFEGFGVWALATQAITRSALEAAATWALSPWRPLGRFSGESFRLLFGFSGYLFLASLLDVAYRRIYTLIVGKLFGVRELGLYDRADRTKQLPTAVLTRVLSKVAFPVFSQIADDRERLARGFRTAVRGAMFVNVPLMVGIASVAEPAVVTLFGEKWVESAPLLAILALAGVLRPAHVFNLSALKAMGYSNRFFRLEVFKKMIGIGLLVGGAMFGLQGIAWAMVASSVLSFILNAYYSGSLLDYGAWKQALDFLPVVICAAGMAVAVYFLDGLIELGPLRRLAFLSLTGGFVYVLLVLLLRVPEATRAVQLVKDRIGSGAG